MQRSVQYKHLTLIVDRNTSEDRSVVFYARKAREFIKLPALCGLPGGTFGEHVAGQFTLLAS